MASPTTRMLCPLLSLTLLFFTLGSHDNLLLQVSLRVLGALLMTSLLKEHCRTKSALRSSINDNVNIFKAIYLVSMVTVASPGSNNQNKIPKVQNNNKQKGSKEPSRYICKDNASRHCTAKYHFTNTVAQCNMNHKPGMYQWQCSNPCSSNCFSDIPSPCEKQSYTNTWNNCTQKCNCYRTCQIPTTSCCQPSTSSCQSPCFVPQSQCCSSGQRIPRTGCPKPCNPCASTPCDQGYQIVCKTYPTETYNRCIKAANNPCCQPCFDPCCENPCNDKCCKSLCCKKQCKVVCSCDSCISSKCCISDCSHKTYTKPIFEENIRFNPGSDGFEQCINRDRQSHSSGNISAMHC